jgi:hypothetical protein
MVEQFGASGAVYEFMKPKALLTYSIFVVDFDGAVVEHTSCLRFAGRINIGNPVVIVWKMWVVVLWCVEIWPADP